MTTETIAITCGALAGAACAVGLAKSAIERKIVRAVAEAVRAEFGAINRDVQWCTRAVKDIENRELERILRTG